MPVPVFLTATIRAEGGFQNETQALILTAMLALLSACSTGDNDAAKAYNEAMNAIKQGKYAEAAGKLSGISFYEDSLTLVQYCEAHVYAAEGRYTKAISIFTRLGGYRDSSVCVLYFSALAAEESASSPRERVDAADLFSDARLTGFRDSAERAESIRSALYAEGIAEEEAGNREAAEELFAALGGYRDSTARCAYCAGRVKEEAGAKEPEAYIRVIILYEKADGYSDSTERRRKCLEAVTAAADRMTEAGDFDGAESIFLALGDHSG